MDKKFLNVFIAIGFIISVSACGNSTSSVSESQTTYTSITNSVLETPPAVTDIETAQELVWDYIPQENRIKTDKSLDIEVRVEDFWLDTTTNESVYLVSHIIWGDVSHLYNYLYLGTCNISAFPTSFHYIVYKNSGEVKEIAVDDLQAKRIIHQGNISDTLPIKSAEQAMEISKNKLNLSYFYEVNNSIGQNKYNLKISPLVYGNYEFHYEGEYFDEKTYKPFYMFSYIQYEDNSKLRKNISFYALYKNTGELEKLSPDVETVIYALPDFTLGRTFQDTVRLNIPMEWMETFVAAPNGSSSDELFSFTDSYTTLRAYGTDELDKTDETLKELSFGDYTFYRSNYHWAVLDHDIYEAIPLIAYEYFLWHDETKTRSIRLSFWQDVTEGITSTITVEDFEAVLETIVVPTTSQ